MSSKRRGTRRISQSGAEDDTACYFSVARSQKGFDISPQFRHALANIRPPFTMKLSSYLQWIHGSSFLLRLTFAAFAVWASVAVGQTPATLGVQLDGGHIGISITGQLGQVYHIEFTSGSDLSK